MERSANVAGAVRCAGLAAGVALVAVHLGAGCNTPPEILPREEGTPAPRLADMPEFVYRVGPGDVVRVNVFGHPELGSGVYKESLLGSPVDGLGRVMLPLLGEVEVSGLTAAELASRVEEELSTYLVDPRVDVTVVEHGSQRYFVLGSVEQPGVYAIDRPLTLFEAMARSGGFDSFANRDQVAWISGSLEEKDMLIVNMEEIDPRAAGFIQPGDLVFVGRRDWADVAEATRDIVPLLQAVAIPLSIGLQAATLGKLD